jgi:hypothetical protein
MNESGCIASNPKDRPQAIDMMIELQSYVTITLVSVASVISSNNPVV